MLALAAALPAVPIWAKLKKGAAEEAHCDVDLECGAPEGHSYFDGVPGSPGVSADGWATAERISKPKKVWAHLHQKPKTDDSPELPGDNIISALPASLVKKLYDAFSLEMKIEEAAKGKKGEKKD